MSWPGSLKDFECITSGYPLRDYQVWIRSFLDKCSIIKRLLLDLKKQLVIGQFCSVENLWFSLVAIILSRDTIFAYFWTFRTRPAPVF